MSALIFPDRWRRQPTTPVGIDWGHPLAQGLKHGLTGVRPLVDQVSGVGYTVAASGGVTIEPHWSAQGQTLLFSSQATVQPRLSLASPWRPGASDFTVSCWAVFLRESLDRDTMVVAVRYDSSYEFEWSLSGNWVATGNDYRPGFFIRTNNGGGTFYGASFASKRIIGVPVFVTGVRRGNTVSIYRDGVLEQETATAGTLQTATTGLTLGSGLNEPAFNFNGYLPQFVMWSRALSQSEIRAYVEAPWQFFRPLPRRIYVPSAGTGGGTGTLAVTLGALTGSAAGALAISGTSAVTLGALTSTAAGKLDIKGTSAVTLGALTSTASGTLMSAGTGTAAITLGALTSSAAGKLDIKGSSAVTLGSVTLGAAGVLAAGPNGNANITLGALTSTAVGKLAISGTSAVTLGSLTSAATGAVAIKGVAGIQLGSLTVAASGLQITSDTRIGSAAITLGDLTAEAMAAPLLARLGNRRLREGALRITKGALPTGRVKRGGLPRIS